MHRLPTVAVVFVCLGAFVSPALGQQSTASQKALQSAAAKGSPAAQYALGAAAEDSGDLVQAAAWYQKSANQGYPAAEFRLARLLETGKGISADGALAMSWYHKAADQGSEAAQARLKEIAASTTTASAPLAATGAASLQSAPPTPPADGTSATPPVTDPATSGAPPVADATGIATDAQPPPATETLANPPLTLPTTAPVQTPPAAAPSSGAESWTQIQRIEVWGVVLYVLVSGYCGVRLIRPRMLDWYRSGVWVVGSNRKSSRSIIGGVLLGGRVGEMFFRQVLMRVQIEALTVTLGTILGCVGGNLYYFATRRRKHAPLTNEVREQIRQRVAAIAAERETPEAIAAAKAWHASHASSVLYQLTELPGVGGYQEVQDWIARDPKDFTRAYEDAARKAADKGTARGDFDAQFKGEMRNAADQLEARAAMSGRSSERTTTPRTPSSTFINRV